ncbi:protein FAM221B isoform X2 [Nematostella vectensis]|uniref:protein FAM221B isoform X2 n=1 Tax=Nematostella vectensis TaxID=45351 RepID=UPI0020776513|nr:protein FAM221B isoform X2 [Nematostella vectensis]
MATRKSKQTPKSRETLSPNSLTQPLDQLRVSSSRTSDRGRGTARNNYSRYSPQPGRTTSRVHHSNQKTTEASKAVAHRPRGGMAAKTQGILAPKGYTCRPIVPAEKAELLPVARAMHREEFAPRVKKLFDPEREAALEAIETGIYIGWRIPSFKHDCVRVGSSSKCFCGHSLSEHGRYDSNSVRVPCGMAGCKCKAFAFIPSRAEDVGEYWLQRRPNFDPRSWRAKCKCKHTHEEHVATGMRQCRIAGCGCGRFFSNFLCCACDKHWEEHETVFETERMRKDEGIPYGEAYLPFHELPGLRNAVLTGREDDDSQYMALTSGTMSPYPTVDMVIMAHQNEAGMLSKGEPAIPKPSM